MGRLLFTSASDDGKGFAWHRRVSDLLSAICLFAQPQSLPEACLKTFRKTDGFSARGSGGLVAAAQGAGVPESDRTGVATSSAHLRRGRAAVGRIAAAAGHRRAARRACWRRVLRISGRPARTAAMRTPCAFPIPSAGPAAGPRHRLRTCAARATPTGGAVMSRSGTPGPSPLRRRTFGLGTLQKFTCNWVEISWLRISPSYSRPKASRTPF